MAVLIGNPQSQKLGSIIAYDNLLTGADISDSEKALTPNTYERWDVSAGAVNAEFQLSAPAQVNFVGIAAHSLVGENLVIETRPVINSGSWVYAGGISFNTAAPVLLTFESRLVGEVRLTGTLTADSEIGVISAGEYLQMPVKIYGGHSPITLSQKTSFQSVQSDTGQFLGRNITRKGVASTNAWQFLDPYWYRENFQAFVQSARTLPFFIQWRPKEFPDEVAYAHTTADITPSNMGGGNALMSVSISIRGHNDV
jgi:hypothetical protein